MDSKSELKRICTLRPLEMAARIYKLESQLAARDMELKELDEAKRQLIMDSECINRITNKALKLETQLTAVQDMFSDALQSDLEHGVKSLNENASKEFHEKYPELTQALNRLSDLQLK
jgi:hypothetical protein